MMDTVKIPAGSLVQYEGVPLRLRFDAVGEGLQADVDWSRANPPQPEAMREMQAEPKEARCTCGEMWPCLLYGGPPEPGETSEGARCKERVWDGHGGDRTSCDRLLPCELHPPPKVEPPAQPEAVTIGQTTLLREHLPLIACPPVPEPQTATGETWTCMARRSRADPPLDCDWPVCGCDPAATKVIEALEEAGMLRSQTGAAEPRPEPPGEGQPSPRLEPLWCKHSDAYELYCPACIESIRERIAALENALAGMLDKWGKHSGSCCTFDEAGKVIVTPESCKCAPPEKLARAVLAARP